MSELCEFFKTNAQFFLSSDVVQELVDSCTDQKSKDKSINYEEFVAILMKREVMDNLQQSVLECVVSQQLDFDCNLGKK